MDKISVTEPENVDILIDRYANTIVFAHKALIDKTVENRHGQERVRYRFTVKGVRGRNR